MVFINSETTFQVKSSYVHRHVAGSDVLISIGENIANFNGYIEMNSSAAFLWDIMKSPCTLEQLADALCEKFSLDKEEAIGDTKEFIELLQQHDMVWVNG